MLTQKSKITLGPQAGPQTAFLSSRADVGIYGGAAGGGKSFGLLLEPARHYQNSRFGAVIFRRTTPMITNEGGLWDESEEIYPLLGATGSRHRMEWLFPSGAKIKFAHMQHDQNRLDWQGAQIPMIGFDELTHFTEQQFFYLFSRNRSTSGVPGYIRATTNPHPDHFVRRLIAWWIDDETGFPILERAGVLRWFLRIGDDLKFGDSYAEMVQKFGQDRDELAPNFVLPKSLTFIPAVIYDNKILLKKDPNYLATLLALPLYDREQLLKGNWNVRPSGGLFFKRHWFEIVDSLPHNHMSTVRYWDRAATAKNSVNDPDNTAGVKVSRDQTTGIFYVEHVERFMGSPAAVEKTIRDVAPHDGVYCDIWIEQDPGAAGVFEANYYVRAMAGYTVKCRKVDKDKATRAKPASAQAEKGMIKLVRGQWNEEFLRELENFPDGRYDDQVDGLSGAITVLTEQPAPFDTANVLLGNRTGTSLTTAKFKPKTWR